MSGPQPPPLRVLSLGAGVQSSALALMMSAGEIESVDFACFADTHDEPRAVYAWLDWLRPRLSFPVHVVSAGSLSAAVLTWTVRRSGAGPDNMIPAFVPGVDGAKGGMLPRRCTRDFKIRPIRRFCRAKMRQAGRKVLVQCMGISLDEVQRMKGSPVKYVRHSYPLVDARISRRGCLEWMRRHGFPDPPKSACVQCPYRNNGEWARLKREDPEGFGRAVQFERDLQAMGARAVGSHVMRAPPFLHSSCVPLDQADFSVRKGRPQGNLFNQECEGLCGV